MRYIMHHSREQNQVSCQFAVRDSLSELRIIYFAVWESLHPHNSVRLHFLFVLRSLVRSSKMNTEPRTVNWHPTLRRHSRAYMQTYSAPKHSVFQRIRFEYEIFNSSYMYMTRFTRKWHSGISVISKV